MRPARLLLTTAALLAVIGCQQRHMTLKQADFEPFQRELTTIYTSQAIPALKGANLDKMSDAEAEVFAKRLTQHSKQALGVKVTAAEARKLRKREYAVKVTYTTGDAPPPDGKTVRYFLAEKQTLGWRVKRETDARRFERKLF